MKIKIQSRCIGCNTVVSKKRPYCYGCLTELKNKAEDSV